jgi:coenzyme PQQ synthesis protein D (PqqD)
VDETANNVPHRYAVSPDAAYAAVPGGGVVLHLGVNRYFSLNDTAAMIWAMIEAGSPTDVIAGELSQRFDIDAASADQAVTELVDRLSAAGLLRPAD